MSRDAGRALRLRLRVSAPYKSSRESGCVDDNHLSYEISFETQHHEGSTYEDSARYLISLRRRLRLWPDSARESYARSTALYPCEGRKVARCPQRQLHRECWHM